MNPRLRNTAALLGVTGIVALAGCGTDDTSGVAAAGTQTQNGSAPQGQGPDLSALAEKLGVSEAKVQAAMQSLMPQGAPPSGQPPQGNTTAS